MSDRRVRVALYLLTGLLIAVVANYIHQAADRRDLRIGSAAVPDTLPPGVQARLERVKTVGRAHNAPAWTVYSEKVDTAPNRTRMDFSGTISAELLQQGKVRATVQAASATYVEANKTLRAFGGLTARVGDMVIKTDSLDWFVGANIVRCPGLVTATLPNGTGTIQGEDMTIDLNTHNFKMRNGNAHLLVEESDPERVLRPLKEIAP